MPEEETEKQRIDRELDELLNELRVAIPGAEVLFAFLLGVAFTSTFENASDLQRHVYVGTLLATAAATALLIAPTAYHRLHFRNSEKERIIYSGTRMAIASLVMLLLAVTGVVFLVADVIYGGSVPIVLASLIAAWFVWFWFALPLLRRVPRARRDGR